MKQAAFAEQLHIQQTSRVVKLTKIGEAFYFSTNQYEISYKLAIELIMLIYKIRPECLEQYAQMHLEVNIESSAPPLKVNNRATITFKGTGDEIELELL